MEIKQVQETKPTSKLIHIDENTNIPLLGLIHVGIVDRGSSLLQVRASTYCNMKCTFCSTSANSPTHEYNYDIELSYLMLWIRETINLKDNFVNQINIDSVGEPSAYPKIIELVKQCKSLPGMEYITMQSNGTLLTQQRILDLASAGLSRINLSIHSLLPDQAMELFGSKNYRLDKIKEVCKWINGSSIELNITPVYLPSVNDSQIDSLIEFAKELKCKISIQKYEVYRYSRKDKRVKLQNWYKFYKKLDELEKEHNYKLKLGPTDFKINRSKHVPLLMNRGDIVTAEIIMPGWMKGEMIARYNNRCITIFDCDKNIGEKIKIRILETKDGIYLAKKV